jgi:hypothetical protein
MLEVPCIAIRDPSEPSDAKRRARGRRRGRAGLLNRRRGIGPVGRGTGREALHDATIAPPPRVPLKAGATPGLGRAPRLRPEPEVAPDQARRAHEGDQAEPHQVDARLPQRVDAGMVTVLHARPAASPRCRPHPLAMRRRGSRVVVGGDPVKPGRVGRPAREGATASLDGTEPAERAAAQSRSVAAATHSCQELGIRWSALCQEPSSLELQEDRPILGVRRRQGRRSAGSVGSACRAGHSHRRAVRFDADSDRPRHSAGWSTPSSCPSR